MMTDTTPLDLDGIEARAEAATEGPWTSIEWWPEDDRAAMVIVHSGSDSERRIVRTAKSEQGDDDAEFIAHARTDVPALVEEVKRLRGLSTVEGARESKRHWKKRAKEAIAERDAAIARADVAEAKVTAGLRATVRTCSQGAGFCLTCEQLVPGRSEGCDMCAVRSALAGGDGPAPESTETLPDAHRRTVDGSVGVPQTPTERLRAAESTLRERADSTWTPWMAAVLKEAAEEWDDYRGVGTPFTLDRIDELAAVVLAEGGK